MSQQLKAFRYWCHFIVGFSWLAVSVMFSWKGSFWCIQYENFLAWYYKYLYARVGAGSDCTQCTEILTFAELGKTVNVVLVAWKQGLISGGVCTSERNL